MAEPAAKRPRTAASSGPAIPGSSKGSSSGSGSGFGSGSSSGVLPCARLAVGMAAHDFRSTVYVYFEEDVE